MAREARTIMGWNRRFPTRALALAALLFVLGPAAAQAQGLFPDIYIKRRRPCCAAEDPRYRIVREQYYGYFPTCWRQFPPNWGCYPKDGAPDWDAAVRELPLDPTSLLGEDLEDEGQGPGAGPDAPRQGDRMPELPGTDEDLFNPDGGQRNPAPPPGQDRDPFRQGVGPASGSPAPLGNPGGAPPIEAPRADAVAPPPPAIGAGLPATEGPSAALPDSGALAPASPDSAALAPPLSDTVPSSGAGTGPGVVGGLPPSVPALSQPAEALPGLIPPDGPVGLPSDLVFDGNRPQAPPLAPPSAFIPGNFPQGAIPGPVTNGGGIGPIPDPGFDPIPPAANAEARPDRRRGPIANFLGRMRKR